MSSIFDQILKAAESGAASGAAEHAAPADFDGTRTEPSPDFVLPVAPATKSLYGYQQAAVETILQHRRVLLGLQPGLGKTAIMQAVSAALAAEGRRTLVIVPPSLRVSPWAQEYAADYPHLRVALVTGRTAEPFPDADVVILPDSVLQYRAADAAAWAPAAVMADEAHRYKSRTAKRSQALLALCDDLGPDAVVVPATGTIVANHGVDAYMPLRISGRRNATAVSGGHSYSAFLSQWCETEQVWTGRSYVKVPVGLTNAEALRQRLVSTCYVSVPRSDVLDLPERTTSVRSLVLNGDATEYRRMEREFLTWVAETRGDAAMKRAQKAEAITRMMALWQADGLAKIKASTEYISALVEQGEPVVVFAHHTEVIGRLTAALQTEGLRVGTIVGGMTAESKAEVVSAFQGGDLDVVIGQHEAAGVGLTLHRSSHVVMHSLCWAPGVYAQAQDRVYRIGQTAQHVQTHVLNGQSMMSERLWDVLQAKAAVADAINVGQADTIDQGSVIDAVLESFGW